MMNIVILSGPTNCSLKADRWSSPTPSVPSSTTSRPASSATGTAGQSTPTIAQNWIAGRVRLTAGPPQQFPFLCGEGSTCPRFGGAFLSLPGLRPTPRSPRDSHELQSNYCSLSRLERTLAQLFTLWTTGKLGVKTLHFTQEQARHIVGVSVERLRHWRKTVPYLKHKAGKTARFTFSDMLGLAVTLEVVDKLGLGIATLRTGLDELFEALSRTDSSLLADIVAVVSADGCRLCRVDQVPWSENGEVCLSVPLWPIISRLSDQILPTPPDAQSTLPFPPHVLRVSGQ